MLKQCDDPSGAISALGIAISTVAPDELAKSPVVTLPPRAPGVFIVLDVEWGPHPKKQYEKTVIAYGLRLEANGQSITRIYYTSGPDKKHRLALGALVGRIIAAAYPDILSESPDTVTLVTHFGRGDLAACRDFSVTKREVDNVRGVFTTTRKAAQLEVGPKSGLRDDELPQMPKSKRMPLPPELGGKAFVKLVFRDTILHVPEGEPKSLDAIGAHFDMPKLVLPAGYGKAQMDLFFRDHPALAEAYLERDLAITARFYHLLHQLYTALGLREVPPTMASAAVNLFCRSLDTLVDGSGGAVSFERVFGTKEHKAKRYSKATGRYNTVRETTLSFARTMFEEVMGMGYHGGRTETYRTGVSRPCIVLHDIDLRQAYPTGMTGFRIPDYGGAFLSRDVAAFTADVLGVAEVEFESPAGLRFPVFGVRTDFGLVFPRRGVTIAGAPEIATAIRLGVKVTIRQGVIIPWCSDKVYPFEAFFKAAIGHRERLKKDGRDTLESLIVKTIMNSAYGRTAQAVRPRNVFDTRSGLDRPLPPSKLTNAAFAAATTSLVRAAIAEMLNGAPEDREVISVSTDGFLTSAKIEEIDVSGPACRVMAANRTRLSGNPNLLEYKKHVQQIVTPRNRAAFTAMPVEGEKPVLARGSIKVPAEVEDPNAYLLGLHLDRDGATRLTRVDLVSLRQQWAQDGDLVGVERSTRLNLEPDMKRRLLSPEMVSIAGGPFAGREHLSTGSEPHDTVEEMLETRVRFQGWRDATGRCLKDLSDWEDWQDYLESARAAQQAGRRPYRTAGGSADDLKRQFLRALVRGQWGVGLGERTYADVAAWLTAAGYKTSLASVKNAKRGGGQANAAKRGDAVLVPHSVAYTEKTAKLLRTILAEFPGFRYEEAFVTGHLPRLREALARQR